MMKKAVGATPPKSVNNKIRTILVYPPHPSKGGIPINTKDYARLKEHRFLNDVIIDFYLRYLTLSVLSEYDQQRTHVFSSFFYKRLTTRPPRSARRSHPVEDDPKLSPAEKRHSRVKSWTKNVNLFEKDFIVIPIHKYYHWFLAIICFPGLTGPVRMSDNAPVTEPVNKKRVKSTSKKKLPELESPPKSLQIGCTTITPVKCTDTIALETGEDGSDRDEAEGEDEDMDHSSSDEEDAGSPSEMEKSVTKKEIVTESPQKENSQAKLPKFCKDSIKQPCILIFDSLAGASRTRVVATLRDYLRIENKVKGGEERDFSKDTIRGASPKVPQQKNVTDCGLYLLQYVESFFQDPVQDYRLPMRVLANWFPEEVVNRKREDLHKLLLSLIEKTGVDPATLNLPKLTFSSHLSTQKSSEKTANSNSEEPDISSQDGESACVGNSTEEESQISNSQQGNVQHINSSGTCSNSGAGVLINTSSDSNRVKKERVSLVNYSDDSDEKNSMSVDCDTSSSETKKSNTLSYLKSKRIERHMNKDIDRTPMKKIQTDDASQDNRQKKKNSLQIQRDLEIKEKQRKQEERQRKKAKKEEEKLKFAIYKKEWKKHREDLAIENLKPLRVACEIDCRIPNGLFGDFMMVLEFLHSFNAILKVKSCFPGGVTFECLERALVETEIAGPLNDVMKILLKAIFELQMAEEEKPESDVCIAADPNLDTLFDQESTMPQDAIPDTIVATGWRNIFKGVCLNDIPIDHNTVSEILRLHLLSSGGRMGDATSKWSNLHGYTNFDDPGLWFRVEKQSILLKLCQNHVCELLIGEKLDILCCLVNQVLTYAAVREKVEDLCEQSRKTKTAVRSLQIAESKLQKEATAKRIQEKKEEKLALANNSPYVQSEQTVYEKQKMEKEMSKLRVDMQKKSSRIPSLAFGSQLLPLGCDRAHRKFWLFSSLPGLFIEYNPFEIGPCLPQPTPQTLELSDTLTHVRKLFEEEGHNSSDKENDASDRDVSKPHACSVKKKLDEKNISVETLNTVRQNGKEEQIIETEDADEEEFLICTASESCPVHYPSVSASHWSFFSKQEDVTAFIGGLNERGVRESALLHVLKKEEQRIMESVAQCPAHKLNPTKFEECEQRKSTRINRYKSETVNLKFPANTPVSYIMEWTIRENILALENKITNGGVGSLKVKDRMAWRRAIENGLYDKQCENIVWGFSTHNELEGTKEKKGEASDGEGEEMEEAVVEEMEMEEGHYPEGVNVADDDEECHKLQDVLDEEDETKKIEGDDITDDECQIIGHYVMDKGGECQKGRGDVNKDMDCHRIERERGTDEEEGQKMKRNLLLSFEPDGYHLIRNFIASTGELLEMEGDVTDEGEKSPKIGDDVMDEESQKIRGNVVNVECRRIDRECGTDEEGQEIKASLSYLDDDEIQLVKDRFTDGGLPYMEGELTDVGEKSPEIGDNVMGEEIQKIRGDVMDEDKVWARVTIVYCTGKEEGSKKYERTPYVDDDDCQLVGDNVIDGPEDDDPFWDEDNLTGCQSSPEARSSLGAEKVDSKNNSRIVRQGSHERIEDSDNDYDPDDDLDLSVNNNTKTLDKEVSSKDMSSSTNFPSRNPIVKDLAGAILQLGQSLDPTCLQKPLAHSPPSMKHHMKQWEISLMNSMNFSQLCIHQSTLEKSINWSRSTFNAPCVVCGKRKQNHGRNMVFCEKCNKRYHIYCLFPRLKCVPEGNWNCPSCTLSEKTSVGEGSSGEVKKSISDDDARREAFGEEYFKKERETNKVCTKCAKNAQRSELFDCKICCALYHLECMSPRIPSPRELARWYCEDCKFLQESEDSADENLKEHSEESSTDFAVQSAEERSDSDSVPTRKRRRCASAARAKIASFTKRLMTNSWEDESQGAHAKNVEEYSNTQDTSSTRRNA